MPYVVYPSASSSLNNYTQRFTSSTTWVAPTGCKLIDLVCVGGGGGGGYAGTTSNVLNGGGGGAGGEVVRRQLAVTAGQSYQIIVGAGGAGGIAAGTGTDTSTPAQAGGFSSFNLSYTLENAVYNGAAEANNTSILGASAANNISTGTFPTWTVGYTSGTPSTGQLNNYATPSPAITGISLYWRHGDSFDSNGRNHGVVATWVPITGSTQYTYSAYLQGSTAAATGQGNIRVDYYTSQNGSLISGQSGTQSAVNGNTTWNRYTLTHTSPSNATYALFRTGWWHQNGGSSGQYNVTGIQVESGSSVTDYVGINTAGIRYVTSLGILSSITGVIAEGGGGGNSAFNSSTSTGIGYGGGANHPTNTSAPWYAGNGSGAGGLIGDATIFSAGNSATTNFFYVSGSYAPPSGSAYLGTGSPGMTFHSTGAIGRQPSGAPATFDGFGAGGMGAYNSSNFYAGQNGYGAGVAVNTTSAGASALANTGAGGGGAMIPAVTALRSGGNGGSGIVLISYLAE